MSEEKIFPLIKRKTPVLDLVRGNPEFAERPLFGVLAETPDEIRSLRRGIVSGLATVAAITLFLAPVLARAPEKPK